MRTPSILVQAFWALFLVSPTCCMGQQHAASLSKAVALADHPAEIAQRLVEFSRSRFDLQCKGFGVQEVLEALDLAHRLKVAAARLENHEEAERAADDALLGQLEQISALVEMRCQRHTTPIIDRELIRYRVLEASANVKKHSPDKAREVECRRKAVAAVADLRRALMVAYKAGVLPWTDLLRLSQNSCQAEIRLINVTTDDSAQATKSRAAVLEKLLVVADDVLGTRRELFKCGLVSGNDLDLARVERSRIAACLARERGNREAELGALQGIVDDQSRRLERTRLLYEQGGVPHNEYEKVAWEVKVAQNQLREAKLRYEADDASPEDKRRMLFSAQRDGSWMLEEEFRQAERDLAHWKSLHKTGVCDEFAVVEAMARCRLTELSYRQCQLDLRQLQKDF